MAKKLNSTEFYTENELYQRIESLNEENISRAQYIEKLEEILRLYRNQNGNEALNILVKKNLQYEVRIKEQEEKINELVEDLTSAEEDISNLEGRLKTASATVEHIEQIFKSPVQSDQSN
ncbi:MAG: hypothetical protein V1914_03455 [archaeon]